MFVRIIQGRLFLAELLFFAFIFVLGIISGFSNLAGLADAFSQR